jgi:alpha-glucosidase (family GH31 glycosyl hydrolase)
VGAFYPFSRNHNSRSAKDQYPWTFGQNIENIIKKDIMVRYSLIRYFYSQLFLVSLNEKGAFFKPVMFEYPLDKNSYDDIESKIMLGEALLLCAFFENHEKNKTFIFPNSNFNMYPSGYTVLNYTNDSNYSNKLRKSLSGKLNELHLFMRGGYIIPMQDTFDNYVMNTYYLRQQKINLIINPDHEGYSKGTIFFDNDEIDTIELEKYIRVNLEFKNKILSVEVINKKKMDYIFKDNIINRIEIWRVNEIMEFNSKKDNEIVLKYDLTSKKEKQIKGKIDLINNKLIIDFNENNIDINLFTLEKVYLN